MTIAWLITIVFVAAILQALTGFGFALVVMPLATLVIDLKTAAPLIALVGLTANVVNVIRFRRAVDLGEVARLGVGSALGVPVGIWALVHVDELTINRIMGVMLLAYAAYALLQQAPKRGAVHSCVTLQPPVKNSAGGRSGPAAGPPKPVWQVGRGWACPAGFAAGCLGGAYNTPGPPVVVYGALRQWPKDEYRAMVQTVFLINGALVVGSHLLAGHVVAQVWEWYVWAAPALLLGLWTGARLDRYLDQERFRTLVTVMILVLGLSLLFGVGRR